MGLWIDWRRWLVWLAMIVGAAVAASAAAATVEPGPAPLQLCIGTSTAPAAALFDRPDQFDCERDQADLGPGNFWIRARTLPPGAGTSLTRIRVGSQWMSALTLYARYADGHVHRERLDSHAISRHVHIGANVEFTLPERGERLTGLLWRVEKSGNFRRVLGGVEMASAAAAEREDDTTAVFYAAFAGLCIALIVYNLALWAALRRQFQLAYCAMVGTIALYATSSSGAILKLLPAMPNNPRIEIVYLLLPVTMAASLWFAQTFFQPGGLPRRLNVAVSATIAWLLTTSALFALLAPSGMLVVDKLIGLGFAAVLLLTAPLLAIARRRGYAFLIVFALAWAAPATMAWMRTANVFHLTANGFSLQYGSIAIMAVEALLSSVAIAYRIHLLGRERDEARTQEIAARLLADTDPLTGLLNRRAFLSRAIGRPGDQALVIVDIDRFKQVNETIGHDGGDDVLRIVARTLHEWAGTPALVARMGGEEFAVVFEASAVRDTGDLLDRLRAARMPYDLTVTASIGACLGPLRHEVDWKRLYQAADRALFQAKAAGRDRSRTAEPLAA